MNRNKTATVIFTALLAAMCCVATMVIRIPSPLGGYINLGDGLCLLSGLLLGPLYGFIAAGVGSALADALSGYFIYIPGTLVIKGAIACLVCFLMKWLEKNNNKTMKKLILACSIAELLTPLGYFLYELLLYGVGAAAAIPGNCVQAAAGVVIACVLYPFMKKALKEER